ncbi:ribosomal L32p protein family [Actinidia rufa]|uniref:Ribosomal L32p protein family n=1 Tax=Actinidia rufa TaxID=165716 RepID=A0A7J0HED0_9ERIC|nr:ribosomal L32p protein family [Actinidia rufa]
MALRAAMLKSAGEKIGSAFGHGRRWAHTVALPPPLGSAINPPTVSPSLVLPEIDRDTVNGNGGIRFEFPSFSLSVVDPWSSWPSPKRRVWGLVGIHSGLILCILLKDFSAQERHQEWTKGFKTYSSDHPLQELWSSQAATFLLLQWREGK